MGFECPICGNDRLKDYNSRVLVQCTGCKALERTRLLYLALEQELRAFEQPRVLHFAPEVAVMPLLRDALGPRYVPADLDPGRYPSGYGRVRALDACADLELLRDEHWDVIIHNHILEHVPCAPEGVLTEMVRLLRPGGIMLFSVPFRGDRTDEDLSTDLSDQERRERFGQEDHVRIFGREDFGAMLRRLWGGQDWQFPFRRFYDTTDFERARIPLVAVDCMDGSSIFHYRKPVSR